MKKNIITIFWITLSVVTVGMVTIPLYLIYSFPSIDIIGHNNVKRHFEYFLATPFPKEAEIVNYDCPWLVGGGGYICEATIEVSEDTYNLLRKKRENNETKNILSWTWYFEDKQTLYFKYVN